MGLEVLIKVTIKADRWKKGEEGNLFTPKQQFFDVIYVYFSPKCKVMTQNNKKKSFVVVIPARTPQNLRARAGDCMRPD